MGSDIRTVPALCQHVLPTHRAHAMLRRYATVASKPPSRLRARGKTPVGLDHVRVPSTPCTRRPLTVVQFIQRQRALALWRDIVRSTANIPDVGARKDMRQFARSEFHQHRSVTDLVSPLPPTPLPCVLTAVQGHIRYLISVRRLDNTHCFTLPFADACPVWKDAVPNYQGHFDQFRSAHRIAIS
jgi:hypothetical protein